MSAPALPRWADVVVLPLVNLGMALLVAGIVVALIGQNPLDVLKLLVHGAFGTLRGFSYTLYYTTTFILTGLAVAVAAHGGLFNIGAEGQAMLGGLGAGLLALWLAESLPAALMLPLVVLAAAAFGAAWAAIPAYLQAYRGSHIVITTIMFNFIAYSLLVYLLVNVLKPPGTMAVESAAFAPSAHLPTMSEALAPLGIDWPATPLNVGFFLALAAAALEKRPEEQAREQDADRMVAAHHRHRDAGEARAGDEVQRQLALHAGDLVDADQTGQRARQAHRGQHLPAHRKSPSRSASGARDGCPRTRRHPRTSPPCAGGNPRACATGTHRPMRRRRARRRSSG